MKKQWCQIIDDAISSQKINLSKINELKLT